MSELTRIVEYLILDVILKNAGITPLNLSRSSLLDCSWAVPLLGMFLLVNTRVNPWKVIHYGVVT